MQTEPLDSDVVDALIAELADPAVLARLVRLYLDKLGDRLEEVVNAEDAAALTAAAHSLKAASATFGAVLVADVATQLEELGERGEEAPAPLLDGLLEAAEDARRALEQIVADAEAEADVEADNDVDEGSGGAVREG
ncbi:Hpt domain-containing protein [Conexibacter sp. CPCC 206217]|uniref:Hpt domain-containing protein n=1 Tax=Conexibacter sp. CPCC 206217 TaxID=3064574 RepID=UPI00271923C9|nr:Hpt domain-containing protein [Conexibacter sp. CPCC 206217]MDO8212937.1 Hpt domain-containing protein [Conexibacter sp. CPCC 206217]